jgi:hypothetical protein
VLLFLLGATNTQCEVEAESQISQHFQPREVILSVWCPYYKQRQSVDVVTEGWLGRRVTQAYRSRALLTSDSLHDFSFT